MLAVFNVSDMKMAIDFRFICYMKLHAITPI